VQAVALSDAAILRDYRSFMQAMGLVDVGGYALTLSMVQERRREL